MKFKKNKTKQTNKKTDRRKERLGRIMKGRKEGREAKHTQL